MRDHLSLYVNGRPVQVRGEDAFLTLSEFLRRRHGLTGTKVVCAEGDCGSCSVMVGRLEGDRLHYAPLTSCIQMMFQLDAAHVVTVEGLREGRELNPIQQATVKCHGAQCGFCTPGFVVSLYDLMRDGRPCDAETVRRGLVGNLCRCTGYDSIIRSALETDRAGLKPIDQLYPPAPIVAALSRATVEEVLLDAPPRRFYKPVLVDRAVRFRAENPRCVIVAGATDVGVQCNKRLRELTVAMSTAGLAAIRSIKVEADALHVGATATLTELERTALVHLPELGRFLAWFGSPPIKNAGTLAGNLVNASPIGDTIPALMVLDAEVELTGPGGTRRVNINQFYTGYRKTVLASDEIVTGVRIPLPAPGEIFKLYKVSRRKDLDISTFGAAIRMRLSGRLIEDIRIAYGGVAAMVVRLPKTEAFLRGSAATLEKFELAGAIAREEITPISDVRGSAQYRLLLAGNILTKFWHDVSGGQDGAWDNATPSPAHGAAREPALARNRNGGQEGAG